MEKFATYDLMESKKQRIDLHKNFRSRNEVLDCTNDIFYRIMQRDLGNVAYDKESKHSKDVQTMGCSDCSRTPLACSVPTLHQGLDDYK